MAKYTDFWKKILETLKEEINPESDYENRIIKWELPEIGNRKSYNGKLELFAFEVRSATDSQVFDDLHALLLKEKSWRGKLSGELIIRVQNNSEVEVKYTPFSWEVMMNRYRDYQDRTQMESEIIIAVDNRSE